MHHSVDEGAEVEARATITSTTVGSDRCTLQDDVGGRCSAMNCRELQGTAGAMTCRCQDARCGTQESFP